MFRVFLEEYADVENGQKKVRFPRCFVIYTIEVITKKNFLLAKLNLDLKIKMKLYHVLAP